MLPAYTSRRGEWKRNFIRVLFMLTGFAVNCVLPEKMYTRKSFVCEPRFVPEMYIYVDVDGNAAVLCCSVGAACADTIRPTEMGPP
jgi:hypothetical protein